MKRALSVLVLMFFVTGCGDGGSGASGGGSSGNTGSASLLSINAACDGSLALGRWTRTTATGATETLRINADCTFSDDFCGSTGTIQKITDVSATAQITVLTKTNSSCLAVGNYASCAFEIDDTGIPVMMGFNCGTGNSIYKRNDSVPVPPTPPSTGIVVPTTVAGGTLTFSGSNVMSNLGFVGTSTGWGTPPANDQNFMSPQAQNTLSIGTYTAATGTTYPMVGNCAMYPGTQISLISTPQSAYSSSLTGSITLSSAFMMANYPQGMPAPLGIAIDVWATTTQLYGGMVYICTSRDQSGGCHGAYFAVTP